MATQAASPSQKSIAVALLPVAGSDSDEEPFQHCTVFPFCMEGEWPEVRPCVSFGQWLVALSYGQGLGRREIEGLVARRCLAVRFSQWAQTLRECLSQVTVHQRALLERSLLTSRGCL